MKITMQGVVVYASYVVILHMRGMYCMHILFYSTRIMQYKYPMAQSRES